MERRHPEDMRSLVNRLGSLALFILLLCGSVALAGLVSPIFWLVVVAVVGFGVWVLLRWLRE